MARKVIKVYNKETRKWETKIVDEKDEGSGGSSGSSSSSSASSSSSSSNKSPSKSKAGYSKATDPKSAKGKAARKKNKIEYYTLTGTLNILPNRQTIKIKANDVVRLNNLGNYLSGKYYVASVTRTVDTNGYSQELELFKPNFREQFKSKKEATKTKKKKKKTTKKKSSKLLKLSRRIEEDAVNLNSESVEVDATGLRIHTIGSTGETLWTIAKRYYGDSSKWNRIYLLNTGEKPDPLNLKIGMKLVIP